ncbi:MAG: glutamate-1-semialdehyde 2,1-aminomutase [Planctomycetaceae bacterium]|jgi:glutamate-1-semialdehyde 2,1-aminomutase|nr:glutamate-1-semialdehyde 2,1-aminomutase [Planctomycetaceae bacterium]
MQHTNSSQLFDEAQGLIPGGVNSPARAFGAVGGHPIFISHGDGAWIYDVDGNCYLDFVQSWGPLILGHRHPAVIKALEETLKRGTSFGAPTADESELAKLIIDTIPSVEKVRLVNSGTEATMSAIRLARGYTGRQKIVKFVGNYHGHVDSLLVSIGSAGATLGVVNSPGVTSGTVADTYLLQYNDVEGVKQLFAEHGDEIAAVILEPVAGNMGCVAGSSNFLYELRSRTAEHRSILIFDEVLCGYRVGLHGAQGRFSIMPDLTTLGKVIGGGLPVGAYGGRAEIMDCILPVGKVFQAGTLSGNPLACAAGIATLRQLRDTNPYPGLERKAALLAEGFEDAARKAGVPVFVSQWGSMVTMFFLPDDNASEISVVVSETVGGNVVNKSSRTGATGNCRNGKIIDWDSVSECNTKRYASFFWGMLERGFYLPCSQFETLFISTAMTEEDIESAVAAADEVLGNM